MHRFVIPPSRTRCSQPQLIEEVPEGYERACDLRRPVAWMNEQPVHLVNETSAPIPATTEPPERVNYESTSGLARPPCSCSASP